MAQLSGTLIEHVEARAEGLAAEGFLQKRHGVWRRIGWGEVWGQAQALAAGLGDEGCRPGESVAIVSGARVEAVTAIYACQRAGLRPVLLNPNLGPAAVATCLQDADCIAVVAEDQEQVDKIADVQSRLPALRRVWVIDPKGVMRYRHIAVRPLGALMATPASAPSAACAPSIQGQATDALALFTAGVYAEPRLVSVSHATLLGALSMREKFALEPGQRVVSLFGLADALGHFFSVVAPALFGTVPCFGEDRLPSVQEMRQCAPRMLAAPARLLDRLRRETAARANAAGGMRQGLIRRWVATDRPGAVLRTLVGEPIAKGLGLDRCERVACGYDRMSTATSRFLSRLGIGSVGLYALAEAGGPVGIFDDAQSMALSFFGAYPATVAAGARLSVAIAGRCVSTGDLVAVESGQLRLLGRAADLLTLRDGRHLAPGTVETELMASPYINQAVALGGATRGVSALIELDEVTLRDWARAHSLSFTTLRTFAESSEVMRLIEQAVEEANQRLAPAARIVCHVLLPRALDPSNGELTPSLALRRSMVRNRYAHRLTGVST